MISSRNASYALTGGQSDRISEFKASAKRTTIAITNLDAAGGAYAFISVGEEAKANTGLPIGPGQTVTFSRDGINQISQEAYNAYTAAAGTTLAIYEEIEVL